MKKLAIITCKATKKDYKCSAEQMYSDSPQFKHQIGFIKEYYDDYMILSLKYGVVDRQTEIEPYNLTLTKSSNFASANPTITDESRRRWGVKVKKQIANLSFDWNRIDLHFSEAYINEIQDVIGIPNVNHIKLPSILQMKANYGKATEILDQTGDVQIYVVSNYVKWRNIYKDELLNKKIVLPWI